MTRELDITLSAYGVLSRGLLSGNWSTERSQTDPDFRSMLPRFASGNLETNLELVERMRELAKACVTTVAGLAIAWVLSRGRDIVPVIGARRRDRFAESLAALDVSLSDDDIQQIERAVPRDSVAGEQYDPHGMAILDSER